VTRAVVAAALAALLAAPAVAAPPSRVQVVAREFSFALSRPRVKPGPAVIELVNFGQDAHDLRLRRIGGTKVYAIKTVQSGGHAQLRVRLLRGRYALWCSIANHRALGMRARLVVR
jgi:plastocyanin